MPTSRAKGAKSSFIKSASASGNSNFREEGPDTARRLSEPNSGRKLEPATGVPNMPADDPTIATKIQLKLNLEDQYI